MLEQLIVPVALPMIAWMAGAIGLIALGWVIGRKFSGRAQPGATLDFESAMDPELAAQIHQFREQQGALFGTMNQEIRNLSSMQNQLSQDTTKLAQALRGSSNVQGQWGELQLRTVLELSGMLPHVDFVEQSEIEGGLRPDVIIHLPEGRQLVVDSKAPMSAYMAATQESLSDEARGKFAAKLAQNLRKHAQGLANKQYWQALAQSPDFVLMFVPNDAMLGLASEAQPGLFQELANSRVLVVSPTTLIALAKTLAYAWRQHGVEERSAQLVANAEALYDQLSVAAGEFRKMGKDLASTVECYNSLLTTMETRVVPSAKLLSGAPLGGSATAPTAQGSVTTMPLGSVVENRRANGPLH